MRRFIASESVAPVLLSKFVFLGGTCNNSTWREELIKLLTVRYFNPVLDREWTEDDVRAENQAKAAADVSLYVITPKQLGFYTLVEMAIAASNSNKTKVVIAFINEDCNDSFTEQQVGSNDAIKGLLLNYSTVEFCDSLKDVADFLNTYLGSNDGN